MPSKGAVRLSEMLTPKRELELSQSELARRLGVTPQAVSSWIKGDSLPKPEHLRKLEDIAHIPMRDWTEEADTEPSGEYATDPGAH